jgi:tRNA (guanine37-N1)-methyltransferase
MVFFAGIGAYAVAMAVEQPDVGKVYAIEINPDAVEYMKQNMRINRIVDKVVPILDDVRKAAKEFYGKCDRVVMPLPLGASEFLEDAINCLRGKGIIHFYTLTNQGEFVSAKSKIEEVCRKLNKTFKILNKRKVSPYSPRKWKVAIDIKIEENNK